MKSYEGLQRTLERMIFESIGSILKTKVDRVRLKFSLF